MLNRNKNKKIKNLGMFIQRGYRLNTLNEARENRMWQVSSRRRWILDNFWKLFHCGTKSFSRKSFGKFHDNKWLFDKWIPKIISKCIVGTSVWVEVLYFQMLSKQIWFQWVHFFFSTVLPPPIHSNIFFSVNNWKSENFVKLMYF